MKRNYDDPAYKEFRKCVLKRDKYKCMMCKNKTQLQVHHIKKWSRASALRYEVSNGITLCKKCHDRIKGYEHQYEHFFRVLIDEL
jgi:5-methylcytosine-specific restriction endonuclease McrA